MSLAKAQNLYQDEQYPKCIDECIATIKAHENVREAYTLCAKAVLPLLNVPIQKNSTQAIFDTIKSAIQSCESIEEVYDVIYEIEFAVNPWEKKALQEELIKLENNASLENYQTYLKNKNSILEVSIGVPFAFVDPKRNALLEKEGLTAKEAEKKYRRKPDNNTTSEDHKNLECEAAQRIFATIQTYIDNNYHGDSEHCQTVAATAVDALLMLDSMISATHSRRSIEQLAKEEITDRLRFHAEVLTYLMDATLSLNGRTISIYRGDQRRRKYYEIQTLYEKIQTYDPTYVSPPLPNIEAVSPPPAKGGCYVATAVYGSYDCPEVWTLRRFRDDILASSLFGRAFIRTYYAISPALVKWFGDTRWFRSLWKGKLDRLVSKLQQDGIESTPYQDKEW